MNPSTIITYAILPCATRVSWWKLLLCRILGHRWPEWQTFQQGQDKRNCKRCHILGVRAPAWTVLP